MKRPTTRSGRRAFYHSERLRRAPLWTARAKSQQVSLRLAVLAHEPETDLGAFAAPLRAAGVNYELLSTTHGKLPDFGRFDGVIALGGSFGADDVRLLETRRWIRSTVQGGLPFLGICLGGQLLASALDANVARGQPELGIHDIFLSDAAKHDPLFTGLPRRLQVLGWHEDSFDLPSGAVSLAHSTACTYQAFRVGAAAYGLQFHPEVRVDALERWRNVRGYRELAELTGTDFDAVAIALKRATPALDSLVEQLFERWLYLVRGVTALTSPLHAAA